MTHTTWQTTYNGDFQGQPPTGKRIEINRLTIERIKDSRIVERWLKYDQMELMQQLGVVPTPEQG